MSKINKKTVVKTISLTPGSLAQVEQLMNDERINEISLSGILRFAIQYTYNDFFKTYKHESVNKDKEKKRDEQEKIEAMPDEEFAIETFHAAKSDIVKNDKGEKFILVHWIGNTLKPIPVVDIKKWADINADMVNFHLNKLKNASVESTLSESMKQVLKRNYGIVFE